MSRDKRGFRQSRVERAVPRKVPFVKEEPKSRVSEGEEKYRRWITRRRSVK